VSAVSQHTTLPVAFSANDAGARNNNPWFEIENARRQPTKLSNSLRPVAFLGMPNKPIKIEIVQEGDNRFMVKPFADGTEERMPIVKLPRKKRYPDRPYWTWSFDKTRKKGV
jgi:hypothetical protein